MAELPPQTNPAGGRQGVPRQTSTPQQIAAPNPNLNPNPAMQQSQEQGDKKPRKWIWIIVGLIVLAILSVGAWFFFFR